MRERICVDGAPISDGELASLAEAHSPAVAAVALEHEALSHFEVLTGLALRHFADQKVRPRPRISGFRALSRTSKYF